MNPFIKFTPENITTLESHEIFVFGSNKLGHHAGGAAKLALESFGAIEGQSEGLQGQSYAIPTLDASYNRLSLSGISESIKVLYDLATYHPTYLFYVTKIGCGIAGFKDEEIAKLFKESPEPPINVILPREFTLIRGVKGFNLGLTCSPNKASKSFKYKKFTSFTTKSAKLCHEGFHFCINALETLFFYKPNSNHEFAEVSGEGQIDLADTSKVAVSKINIYNKISFKQLIENGLEEMHQILKYYNRLINNLKITRIGGVEIKRLKPLEDYDNKTNKSCLVCSNDKSTIKSFAPIHAVINNSICHVDDFSHIYGDSYNCVVAGAANVINLQYNNHIISQQSNIISLKADNNIISKSSVINAEHNNNILAGDNSTVIIQSGNKVISGRTSTIHCFANNLIIADTGSEVVSTGADNIIIVDDRGNKHDSKVKGKKDDIIYFIGTDFNDQSWPFVTKEIKIDGEIYKEDVFYSFRGNKIVEVE